MNKLWVRLSLAFTGVVLVAVLIVVATTIVLQRVETQRDLTDRLLRQSEGLVEQLETYYQMHHSWAGVEPMLIGAQATFFRPDVAFFLADADQDIIYDRQIEEVGQSLNQIEPTLLVPIEASNQTIGYLGLAPIKVHNDNENRLPLFTRFLGDVLLVVAAVGGLGGVVYGVIMSRLLTAPLNTLAQAARAIGHRDYSQRVAEKGSDEVVAVTRAFNDMAAGLEQAEQLRRNLLADVAHELRTPLTVLQGNLRAILDEVFPCDNTEIARLYEHTRFLSRLINDLHELAQAEAKQLPLDRHETNLAQLVTTTIETIRPNAEAKQIALCAEVPPDLPLVQIDAGRIRQVLQNLLANALRHTPEGGAITLHAGLEANTINLAVSDTGDGIPPEHLVHVFDRFYRTDPARSRDQGGAGLGLAIARAIVSAHNGAITVDSAGVSGQGTTFTIKLPVNNGQEY
jgi:two-component system OmpR family sensor kinase